MIRATARTEFIDNKKTIIMRGHYTGFVCGALTMIDKLVRKGLIQNVTMVDNYETMDSDYICSAIKFKKKSDYIAAKEVINFFFDSDEDNWQPSEDIIKIIEDEEKKNAK